MSISSKKTSNINQNFINNEFSIHQNQYQNNTNNNRKLSNYNNENTNHNIISNNFNVGINTAHKPNNFSYGGNPNINFNYNQMKFNNNINNNINIVSNKKKTSSISSKSIDTALKNIKKGMFSYPKKHSNNQKINTGGNLSKNHFNDVSSLNNTKNNRGYSIKHNLQSRNYQNNTVNSNLYNNSKNYINNNTNPNLSEYQKTNTNNNSHNFFSPGLIDDQQGSGLKKNFTIGKFKIGSSNNKNRSYSEIKGAYNNHNSEKKSPNFNNGK